MSGNTNFVHSHEPLYEDFGKTDKPKSSLAIIFVDNRHPSRYDMGSPNPALLMFESLFT